MFYCSHLITYYMYTDYISPVGGTNALLERSTAGRDMNSNCSYAIVTSVTCRLLSTYFLEIRRQTSTSYWDKRTAAPEPILWNTFTAYLVDFLQSTKLKMYITLLLLKNCWWNITWGEDLIRCEFKKKKL